MSEILVSVYDFVTTLFQTSVPGPPGEPEPDLNTAGAVEPALPPELPVVPVVAGPALPSDLIAGRVVAGVEFWSDSASPVVEWAVIEHSEDFVFQLFHTTSAAELDQALPPYLDQFCSHRDLLHADLVWTPRARLARAYRAGLAAHRVLQGLFDKQVISPGFNRRIKNTVYIVARCRQFPGGFYTRDFQIYHDQLIQGDSLEEGSGSHGFPTLIEGEVFLRGCQFRRWPPELTLAP